MYTSAWSLAEMACVFHRQIREHKMPKSEADLAREFFLSDVQNGVWSLLPIPDRFLFRVEALVSALSGSLYLRAGDAIHLAAVQEAGFTEIWSNDKRLLEAAPAFGLTGKSV
jgi:predicted nucleic acid-binding protein